MIYFFSYDYFMLRLTNVLEGVEGVRVVLVIDKD